MAIKNNKLDLLLKEIKDPYVQENFYRLKLYIDSLIANDLLGVSGQVENIFNITQEIVAGAVSLRKVMNCAASVANGNWVYQSTTINNFAIAAVDQSPAEPVIGLVIDKPTSTTCDVMFLGIATVPVGRGYIYLGTSGETTNSAPATGFLQRLGISYGDGQILVRPNVTRIFRV